MMDGKRAPSVVMTLKDMLYVSYLLPAGRIAQHIPAGLMPATVDGENTFLSLVIFKGNTTKAFHIPVPPIPFDQINIRTYVVDPQTGKPAVYFIKCGIRGRLITFLYKTLSGMPVEHCSFDILSGAGPDGHYDDYRVEGNWHGPLTVCATETAPSLAALDPFPSPADALRYLMDPLVGFYPAWGNLLRLEIFHEPLKPRVCRATRVDLPHLERLGLLNAEEIGQPHNLLLVPYTPFEIFLPPKRQKAQAG